MNEKYLQLINKITLYLAANFPGVSLRSDIFEHALLYSLGYQYIPEKCAFGYAYADINNEDDFNMAVRFSTPYGMSITEFKKTLKNYTKYLPITIYEIELSSQHENYILEVHIPLIIIEKKFEYILSRIAYLLSSKEKYDFYKYWSSRAQLSASFSITKVSIENKIRDCILNFPYVSSTDIWNAIVMEANNNPHEKLQILRTHVYNSIEKWPRIAFYCKNENTIEKLIIISREKILESIMNFDKLKKFLPLDDRYELILPANIQSFIKNNLQRFFIYKDDNTFIIALSIYLKNDNRKRVFEKFKIKYSIYSLNDDQPNSGIYYAFDRDNYIKTAIAIKEIEGGECEEERFHSLLYYCYKNLWGQLKEALLFLLNFKSQTGLPIDYSNLAFRLFEYAKENKIEKLIQIVDTTFITFTKNKKECEDEILKKAYSALVEIRLMWLQTLSSEPENNFYKVRKKILKQELFRYSLGAKNPVSNRFFAELCGYPLEKTFATDVTEDVAGFLLELADEIKKQEETLAQSNKQNSHLIKHVVAGTSLFRSVEKSALTAKAESSSLGQQPDREYSKNLK